MCSWLCWVKWLVSTVTSQKEGCGFDSQTGTFQCSCSGWLHPCDLTGDRQWMVGFLCCPKLERIDRRHNNSHNKSVLLCFFCHISLPACRVSTFGYSRPFNVRTRDFIMRRWCEAWSCNKILTWGGESGVVEQAQLAQLNTGGNIVGKPSTAFETAQIIVCKKKWIETNRQLQSPQLTEAARPERQIENDQMQI